MAKCKQHPEITLCEDGSCPICNDDWIKIIHTKDSDCTLNEKGECTLCGVVHGDPCPECSGRGFHQGDCSYLISGNEPDPLADHTDDVCPCGDVDCSRPFGHPTEA